MEIAREIALSQFVTVTMVAKRIKARPSTTDALEELIPVCEAAEMMISHMIGAEGKEIRIAEREVLVVTIRIQNFEEIANVIESTGEGPKTATMFVAVNMILEIEVVQEEIVTEIGTLTMTGTGVGNSIVMTGTGTETGTETETQTATVTKNGLGVTGNASGTRKRRAATAKILTGVAMICAERDIGSGRMSADTLIIGIATSAITWTERIVKTTETSWIGVIAMMAAEIGMMTEI